MDDSARLDTHARLRSTRGRRSEATAMVDRHIGVAPRSYVSWSGGKDSTAVALLAEAHRLPVVRVSHGVDYPEVVDYCAELAAARGWDYRVACLPFPADFFGHADIDRHADTYDTDVGSVLDWPPEGYLYGLRADESGDRAALLRSRRGHFQRPNGQVVTAPLWRWSHLDVFAFLRCHGIAPCPVYARLAALGCPETSQRVGAVFGGGGSHYGRYVWLRRGWPDLWADWVQRYPHLGGI